MITVQRLAVPPPEFVGESPGLSAEYGYICPRCRDDNGVQVEPETWFCLRCQGFFTVTDDDIQPAAAGAGEGERR